MVEAELEYGIYISCCSKRLKQCQYTNKMQIDVKETRKQRHTSADESETVGILFREFRVTNAFFFGVIASWAHGALPWH